MCFNYFRFSHLKNQCKSKKLCEPCGNLTHANFESCPNKDCQPICVRQNHFPKGKSCSESLLQTKVRSLAATSNLSLDHTYSQVVYFDPPSHFFKSYSSFKKRFSPALASNYSSFSFLPSSSSPSLLSIFPPHSHIARSNIPFSTISPLYSLLSSFLPSFSCTFNATHLMHSNLDLSYHTPSSTSKFHT